MQPMMQVVAPQATAFRARGSRAHLVVVRLRSCVATRVVTAGARVALGPRPSPKAEYALEDVRQPRHGSRLELRGVVDDASGRRRKHRPHPRRGRGDGDPHCAPHVQHRPARRATTRARQSIAIGSKTRAPGRWRKHTDEERHALLQAQPATHLATAPTSSSKGMFTSSSIVRLPISRALPSSRVRALAPTIVLLDLVQHSLVPGRG